MGLSRLINQVEPIPFESLSSLMNDLGQRNHYVSRKWYCGITGIHSGREIDNLRNPADFQRFSELTGLSTEKLYALTLSSYEPLVVDANSADSINSWTNRGHRIPIIGWKRQRVCPKCIGEIPRFLLPWRLNFVTTCQRHNNILIDQCSNCGKDLTPLILQCPGCGFSLAEMESVNLSLDSPDKLYSDLVWNLLLVSGGHNMCLPGEITGKQLLLFCHQIVKIYYDPTSRRTVANHSNSLALSTSSLMRQPLAETTKDIHTVYTGALSLLMDWPKNWEEHLHHLGNPALIEIPRWRKQQIRIAYREMLSQSWVSWMESATSRIALQYAEHSGKLHFLNILNPNNEKYSDSGLNSVMAWNSVGAEDVGLVSMQSASRLLGVSKIVFRSLIDGGLFSISTQGSKKLKNFVHSQTAMNFLKTLASITKERSRPIHGSVAFSTAVRKFSKKGFRSSDLVRWVINGELDAFREGSGIGLSALWFLKEDLNKKLWEGRDTPLGNNVNFRQLVRMLGRRPVDVKELIRSGYLEPVEQQGDEGNIENLTFKKETVLHFKQRYLTTQDLARKLDVKSRVIYLLTANGIIPVEWRADGKRLWEHLYDCEAIDRFVSNLLTAAQVVDKLQVSDRELRRIVQKRVGLREYMANTTPLYSPLEVEMYRKEGLFKYGRKYLGFQYEVIRYWGYKGIAAEKIAEGLCLVSRSAVYKRIRNEIEFDHPFIPFSYSELDSFWWSVQAIICAMLPSKETGVYLSRRGERVDVNWRNVYEDVNCLNYQRHLTRMLDILNEEIDKALSVKRSR